MSDSTRVGLSYRSKLEPTLRGRVDEEMAKADLEKKFVDSSLFAPRLQLYNQYDTGK